MNKEIPRDPHTMLYNNRQNIKNIQVLLNKKDTSVVKICMHSRLNGYISN